MDSVFHNLPVLDCHIHYGHPALMPGLINILDQNQIARFNIVCTPHPARLSLVPDALHLKAHNPERTYVFGGLDISALFVDPANCGSYYAGFIERLRAMGCDGIKMIEGKPDMRKMLPIPPFDSPAYAPYWAKLEEMQMPLVFHVNDPEEFWDATRVPGWAVEQGWFYGDGSYINNEEQYNEVLNVLRRHPGIKVVLAHFFFLSNQLERLSDLMEELPNLHVDLTPGIEMYFNFARQPQKTRDFFLRHQDRILYGTDIGAKALLNTPELGIEAGESCLRVYLVRSFLEKDGPFQLNMGEGYLFGKFEGNLHGIGLPSEVLKKIYAGNFERLAGSIPRMIDPSAVIEECQRLAAVIPMVGAAQVGLQPDTRVAAMVEDFFLNLNGKDAVAS
jgi:predicted TIM-barrel fold metal-dependent hydrolase